LRHTKISPEEFFQWYNAIVHPSDKSVNDEELVGDFRGLEVLTNLLNYKVFKHKGLDCPVCKAKGSYFALERTPGKGRTKYNKWHFNLYAKDIFGRDVLMTKDHTHPRSKGGTDDLDNLEPWCLGCNSRKGSTDKDVFAEKIGSRSIDTEMAQCNRVIVSMKQHYDLSVEPLDFLKMKNIAPSSAIILKMGHISYREITYKHTKIIAIWDSWRNSLIGIESYSEKENLFRRMPEALADMQEKADVMFTDILDNLRKEYDSIPAEERTPERFRRYRFPALISEFHRKDETRVKRTVRHIVLSKLAKDLKKNEKREKGVSPI